MERLKTFDDSVSKGNIKGPVGKSIFVENLPLQLFRAIPLQMLTLKVYISSSIHYLIRTRTTWWRKWNQTVLSKMLKIFEHFDKKKNRLFKNHFRQRR